MKRTSLGMIETWGFTPAVEAADTGLKAANVRLLACELTRPALMTVAFSGDVAAVSTAVSAAAAAATRVGRVVATHVIARPDASLLDRFAGGPSPAPLPAPHAATKIQVEPQAGPQVPAATKVDRLLPPTTKDPLPAKTPPDVTTMENTKSNTGAGNANEKKKSAAPGPGTETTTETHRKQQSASRSKAVTIKKHAPKKTPKAAKAVKKKPPAKAPE